MTVPDHRDLVIEMLIDSETTLLDSIVDLVIERDAYRLLAQQAILHCHLGYVELTRLSAGHKRLLHEYRALRKQIAHRELEAV